MAKFCVSLPNWHGTTVPLETKPFITLKKVVTRQHLFLKWRQVTHHPLLMMFSQQASTVCYRRQKGNRHKDQLWRHLSEGGFLPKSTKGQCYLRELHLLWLSCNKFRYLQKTRTFLKILDEELKKRENRVLHKIFNRNTVKISDSCMPNLAEKHYIPRFENMPLPGTSWSPYGRESQHHDASPNLCWTHWGPF